MSAGSGGRAGTATDAGREGATTDTRPAGSASAPVPDGRPAVLIFRKRLLPWSETFIAAQGGALARYRPVFAGFAPAAGGIAQLGSHDRVLLRDHALSPALSKGALKALGLVTPRWRRALEARRPALVHAHFGPNAASAIPIARALGIPLVATFHGMDIAVEARSAARRRQRARVFAAAARVIAVSNFIAGKLRDAGCPPEKIVIHHIGVDTERFAPGDPAEVVAGRVLFVGRLVAKKGLIHLLRAMPRVQNDAPAAELVVAGDGPLRQSLEAEAARLGVRCQFLGVQSQDQVRRLLRTAAVLCAPSIVTRDGNAEGLPITILEAQAAGVPVVAFPSGGSADGFVHEETGFLAPPADEDALADYLARLLGDPDLRRRFSAAARAHAVENFDLRRQTARLEGIYDDVVRAGREARRGPGAGRLTTNP